MGANTDPLYPLFPHSDRYQVIGRLASEGWKIVGTVLWAGRTVTAGAAMYAGSEVSWFARGSIYTLPIAAFLFGAAIRQRSDDRDDQIRDSVRLIIRLAWMEALDQHAKKFPGSRILDRSRPLGLIVLSDRKYTGAAAYLGNIQDVAEKRMMSEAFVAATPMPFGMGDRYYKGRMVGPWEYFVRTNFDDLVARDSWAFMMVEAVSRK